jgi:transcriptional regulator with XRE-family HTH domain
MAQELGVALTTYRSWEQGRTKPVPGHRRGLARAFRVDLAEIGAWLDGTDAAPPEGLTVPRWLGTFASLEQGAAQLQAYETISVHGLLQTRDYAAATARSMGVTEPSNFVRLRMARQHVLRRRGPRLQLSVVMDESVLLREAGDGEVMADQLTHLVTLSSWANVEIRILPLRPRALFPIGNFTLLTSPDDSGPYMACVEDQGGVHYLDRAPDLRQHVDDAALPPEQTVRLIQTTIRERYS